MPYIQGETIREKLNRETQLGIDEAVGIAADIAGALDYAHRHGVIHRDIKPENILLHDGRPMVADFGIALALSAAAGGRMTETGLSLGTPHYMSPEQATAAKDITARSDVYSLASVLYEMLAGSPPHVGSSAQQIIMKIVTRGNPSRLRRQCRQTWRPIATAWSSPRTGSTASRPGAGNPAGCLSAGFATRQSAVRPTPPTAVTVVTLHWRYGDGFGPSSRADGSTVGFCLDLRLDDVVGWPHAVAGRRIVSESAPTRKRAGERIIDTGLGRSGYRANLRAVLLAGRRVAGFLPGRDHPADAVAEVPRSYRARQRAVRRDRGG
jgi:serine/threonine protein kinase